MEKKGMYMTGTATFILLVSFIADPINTSKNVANILAIEGSYFLVQHVLTDFANNHNELIGFTAHCTSAYYGVRILKTGVDGIRKMAKGIENTVTKTKETFESMSKFANIIGKLFPGSH